MSKSLLAELRRRNVIRMAGLYVVGAWLVVQVAETVLPAFDIPSWVLRATIILLAIGFIPAPVFPWVFELTPEGLKRESEVDRSQSIVLTIHPGLDALRGEPRYLALKAAYERWVDEQTS
jgi:hypothetical protein